MSSHPKNFFITALVLFASLLSVSFFVSANSSAWAFAPTPTLIAGAVQAAINADSVRVRAGPSSDGPVVGRLNKGDIVQILARTASSDWWLIAYPDTVHRAWISAQFASPADSTDVLPIASAAPSTPTNPSASLRAGSSTPLDVSPNTPTDVPTPTETPTPTPTPPGRDPKRALFPNEADQVIVRRSKIWYRFEYLGDRTPIAVMVDGFGVRDLEILIYTPEQVDATLAEPRTSPVGRGGQSKVQTGHDLYWTGSFPIGGTYFISVVNNTDHAIVFRLTVSGLSVITAPIEAPAAQKTLDNNSALPNIQVETRAVRGQTPSLFEDIDTIIFRGNRSRLLQDKPPASALEQTVYTIFYPAEMGVPPLAVEVPRAPDMCTPPDAVGVVITQSIKLCPDQTYSNLNLAGSRIGLFGDDAGTAVVKSEGRSFGVRAIGDHILLQGLKIQSSTDPADRGQWVCAFSKCKFGKVFVEGGPVYGGGIYFNASNSLIKDVSVSGGVIGVAMIEGTDNFLINNRLQYQTGWASYNLYAQRTQFLGNAFNYANRDCRGPDGIYYSQGCETAGWICIGCVDILLLNNECKRGGNCYYVSGDGGTPNFNVKFIGNTCYAAPNNCFEATFSKGIYFERNTAKKDPYSGENCNYPFWTGGSEVNFGKGNDWACLISATIAKIRSEADTASSPPGASKPPSNSP